MTRPVLRALSLHLPGGRGPLRIRIAQAVRDAILAGRIRPGEPIPSTRDLARTWQVHRHTVMGALDELAAEGWLDARRGAAYTVCRELPERFFRPRSAASTPAAPAGSAAVKAHEFRIARPLAQFQAVPRRDYDVRFQSGLADLRLFPFDELRSHVADALRRGPAKLLGYGDVAGHGPFRDALGTYLRRVRAVDGRSIVVTHGSQEGIFLVGQVLLAPGDTVAVEDLGYPPAWNALAATGARIVGLPVDASGVEPDALERLCRRTTVRLVYLTPLHQYPTTVTLGVARRMAIYAIAARFGVPILEDDYDHEYHYRCPPLAPLASVDPGGLVIYATTLSKVLYPSARLGALALPPALGDAVLRVRRVVTRQNDTLMQDAVARWIGDGGFERHLRRTRRAYAMRLQALTGCLERMKATGLDLDWRVPDGGMAVWLRTPWSSARVAEAAASARIFVHPESALRLDSAGGPHLRLGFASLTPAEIAQGIERLVACCARLPPFRLSHARRRAVSSWCKCP